MFHPFSFQKETELGILGTCYRRNSINHLFSEGLNSFIFRYQFLNCGLSWSRKAPIRPILRRPMREKKGKEKRLLPHLHSLHKSESCNLLGKSDAKVPPPSLHFSRALFLYSKRVREKKIMWQKEIFILNV